MSHTHLIEGITHKRDGLEEQVEVLEFLLGVLHSMNEDNISIDSREQLKSIMLDRLDDDVDEDDCIAERGLEQIESIDPNYFNRLTRITAL